MGPTSRPLVLAALFAAAACDGAAGGRATPPAAVARAAAAAPPGPAPAPASRAAADAPGAFCGTLPDCFFAGYLAETVDGDRAAAARAYAAVLDGAGPAALPRLGARAALRLAELARQEGRQRDAVDLVARAALLGAGEDDILAATDAFRVLLASVEGDRLDVRGPAAGTALDGVGSEAAVRFRRAEELLVAYHRIQVRVTLEELSAALKRLGDKRAAFHRARQAYQDVVKLDEPVAACAARFRIASLHHDWALAQAIEVPRELLPELAEEVRATLGGSTASHLEKAREAYAASLATAAGVAGAELWHTAARNGARALDEAERSMKPARAGARPAH